MRFHPYDIAHCIGVAFSFITGYLGHICLTLRKEP